MANQDKRIVKFTQDYTVQDENVGTDAEESYTKGQRKSLPAASAKHFVDRGLATYVAKGGS